MTNRSVLNTLKDGPLKVAIIGCGNWGTAVAKLAAINAQKSFIFDNNVYMFVRPGTQIPNQIETDDKLLVNYINTRHQNPTFLPDIDLPINLIATDSYTPIQNSDLIIMGVPHQFVRSTINEINAAGGLNNNPHVLTLVKGFEVNGKDVTLFSNMIKDNLKVSTVSALSGANVAKDIAAEQWCETTIGYQDKTIAEAWQQILDTPNFKVDLIPDISGVQTCGALKNLVAVAVGFADGLGYGTNTKSALMRLGVLEMKLFCAKFFPESTEDVYFESAGFADLVTTCFGGRNVRCASEFVKRGGPKGTVSWEDVEKDILGNQKMQGQLTCKEIYGVLNAHDLLDEFPLFKECYDVSFKGKDAEQMIERFRDSSPRIPADIPMSPVKSGAKNKFILV